ncbi:hypothetical protein PoB_004187900 [Plakobranchus ocellatus]|uniref:Uncharacterized protein n=1 Tax=Plakobranchus ocellatus TaxID=259542 RepID=A0AAV4BAG7_9GAST|nr:hypothetical protein PoB_004187900 [Plakobranchus ocellatus]
MSLSPKPCNLHRCLSLYFYPDTVVFTEICRSISTQTLPSSQESVALSLPRHCRLHRSLSLYFYPDTAILTGVCRSISNQTLSSSQRSVALFLPRHYHLHRCLSLYFYPDTTIFTEGETANILNPAGTTGLLFGQHLLHTFLNFALSRSGREKWRVDPCDTAIQGRRERSGPSDSPVISLVASRQRTLPLSWAEAEKIRPSKLLLCLAEVAPARGENGLG